MSTSTTKPSTCTPSDSPPKTSSPRISPIKTTSIRPPNALVASIMAKLDAVRQASSKLSKMVQAKKLQVEPERGPAEDKKDEREDVVGHFELATLQAELTNKIMEETRLERDLVAQEGLLRVRKRRDTEREMDRLHQRYISAGDDLWTFQKKKTRLGDPGSVRLIRPGDGSISECLLALYRKADGLSKPRRRPAHLRQHLTAFYGTRGEDHDVPDQTWCHVSGMWHLSQHVKAAHIVPFFLESEGLGELLFSSKAPSLEGPGNTLCLSDRIKSWFDKYCLVIVPINATDLPIERWRTDIVDTVIRDKPYAIGHLGKELNRKELEFLNDNRPVSRFMYFHFMMALIRIKDLQRSGWQTTWARYYDQRPFPTPGPYLRQSMLLALATHNGTADMAVVESFVADQGFEEPLTLTHEEATEAARRVHQAVNEAMSRRVRSEDEDKDENDNDHEEGNDGDDDEHDGDEEDEDKDDDEEEKEEEENDDE